MTDLLLDFVTYFKGLGLVQNDGVDIFRDTEPDSPDSASLMHEYGGRSPIPQIAGTDRAIQVNCRDLSATVAKLQARALYKALETEDGILNLTSQRWCMIILNQTPFKIKVDIKERVYYGFNLTVVTYND